MGLIIALLVIGAILLLLETILPGMVAGVAGFGCLLAAVVLGYSELGTAGGNFLLLGVALGLMIGTLVWMRFFPQSRVGQMFVSKKVIGDVGTERPDLLNQTGTALSLLRPSGTAMINGQRVDVVTEGTLIDAGTPIRVVAVEGLRVVVRAAEPVSPATVPGTRTAKP